MSTQGFSGTPVKRLNLKYFWKQIFGQYNYFVKEFPRLFMDLPGLVWSHYLSISLETYILQSKDACHIAFKFSISSYYPHFSSKL